MTRPARLLMLVSLPILAGACSGYGQEGTVLEVPVPSEVARGAELRLASRSGGEAPVLLLEGVELGADERIKIQIVAADGGDGAPVLAQASTVGNGDGVYGPPVAKTTLVFPVNARGCEVIAGQAAVKLRLRIESSKDRPPLQFDRLRFATDRRVSD
ncbi:MAG: hypothetical protein AAGM22_26295 [Acidobacteriota bacterium]